MVGAFSFFWKLQQLRASASVGTLWLKSPAFAPIHDLDAGLVGKEVPRDLAIPLIIVFSLRSVEGGDMYSRSGHVGRVSVKGINHGLGVSVTAR